MIWWIDLSNWKRWTTDFEYRIWSQVRIFDELAQLIMNYIRAKLTCLHILSKYHIIKTLARRWQITGREWCTGFFFFFVVSDEKNLERDELCNRQRSYHFPLFLVVISITLKKKTTKKAVPRLWSFLYLGGKTLTTESWTIKIIKQMISLPIKQWTIINTYT